MDNKNGLDALSEEQTNSVLSSQELSRDKQPSEQPQQLSLKLQPIIHNDNKEGNGANQRKSKSPAIQSSNVHGSSLKESMMRKANNYEASSLNKAQVTEVINLLSNPTIQKLLGQKYKGVSDDLAQVESRPQNQMVPMRFLLGDQEGKTASKDSKLNEELTEIKEEMYGYIDAVIQRQDRGNIMAKFETFTIETAARRSIKELTANFQKQYDESILRVKELDKKQISIEKKVEDLSLLQDKQKRQIEDFSESSKIIRQMQTTFLDNKQSVQKQIDSILDRIENTKQVLESKIETFKGIELKVAKVQQEVTQINKLLLETKQELFEQHGKMNEKLQSSHQRLLNHEHKLLTALDDSKFWMDEHKKNFEEQEKYLNKLKGEMQSDMDRLQYNMGKLVTSHDMNLNIKALNDLLFVKFSQLEDVKQGVRDVLLFQKYFYPLQMQILITKSMEELAVAKQDINFQTSQRNNYERMLRNIEMIRDTALNIEDMDYIKHFEALEKSHLKTNQWKLEPLINPENDFFSCLLNKYIEDLHIRHKNTDRSRKSFGTIIRRTVELDCVHEIIEELYKETLGIRQAIKDREAKLKEEKLKRELRQRCSKHIVEKIDLNKNKCFKRQNSFDKKLDIIYDVIDNDALTREIRALRSSFQNQRNGALHLAQDVHRKRKVKNPFLVYSSSSSEEEKVVAGEMPKYRRQKKKKEKKKVVEQQVQDEISVDLSEEDALEKTQQEPFQDNFEIKKTQKQKTQTVQKVKIVSKQIFESDGQEIQDDIQVASDKEELDLEQDKLQENSPTPKKKKTPLFENQIIGKKDEVKAVKVENQRLNMPKIYVPMPYEEKRKLMNEFSDDLKPTILKLANLQIQNALEPLKRIIKSHENDQIATNNKMLAQMQTLLGATTSELDAFKFQVKKQIEEDMKIIIAKIARAKSDNDVRHQRNEMAVKELNLLFDDTSQKFTSIATAISMLIENVNMQTEAEIADLIDRRQISLFGGQQYQIEKDKIEVTSTTQQLKTFGARNRSFVVSPRVLSPTLINNQRDQVPTPVQSPRLLSQNIMNDEQEQFATTESEENLITPNKGLLPNIKSPRGSGLPQKDQRPQVLNEFLDNHKINDPIEQRAATMVKKKQQIPLTIQQNCLSCTQGGHDTSMVMKLFKTACLNYKASDVVYRDQTMTRGALIGLRRDLIDKITNALVNSKLFNQNLIYPRRYFDDLILEQRIAVRNTQNEFDQKFAGVESQAKFQEMLAQKLPFGTVSGKNNGSLLNLKNNKFNQQSNATLISRIHTTNGNNSEIDTDEKQILRSKQQSVQAFVPVNPGELVLDKETASTISQLQMQKNIATLINRKGTNIDSPFGLPLTTSSAEPEDAYASARRSKMKSKVMQIKKQAQAPSLVHRQLHQLSVPNVQLRGELMSRSELE